MKKLAFYGILFLLVMSTVQAAGYLHIEGVDGESTDAEHDKWIEILSFDQGIRQPQGTPFGGSRRRATAILGDVVIIKESDKATPKIQEACALAETIPEMEVHIERPLDNGSEVVYLRYEFKNVKITSSNIFWETQMQAPNFNPFVDEFPAPYMTQRALEEMTIKYDELKMTYTEYDDDGSSAGNVEFEYRASRGR